MHGFDVGETSVLTPPVDVDLQTRERLIKTMAAATSGATPEEITGWLTDGFPPQIAEQLGRPLEAEEMSAYVDVFLGVMQTAVVEAAV